MGCSKLYFYFYWNNCGLLLLCPTSRPWLKERKYLRSFGKRITCKTCSNVLVRAFDEIVRSRVSSPEGQSSVFHVVCASCTNERSGQIFICISCRLINNNTFVHVPTNQILNHFVDLDYDYYFWWRLVWMSQWVLFIFKWWWSLLWVFPRFA